MCAAMNGSKEVVQLLLERGAKYDSKDKVSDLLFPTVERVTVCLYCGIVIASHECSEPLTWCGVPP